MKAATGMMPSHVSSSSSASKNKQDTIVYGSKTIHYTPLYVDRKTMEVAVHPDSSVVVKIPLDSSSLLVEEKLYKRARWIVRQLNYFEQFLPKTPVRQYINGETHLYLGRQYRLKTSQGSQNNVKLTRGYFNIICQKDISPKAVELLIRKWYLEKAHIQFNESINRCWPKLKARGVAKPPLAIKRMKKRWGSLSINGTVTLNTDLIRAPKECIDYVVIHELCHLKFNDHSSEFYSLLEKVIPNWQKIKHKLELSMI